MLKLNWIYTALFALLLFLGGCDQLIYDDPVDEGSNPTVYLSVSYGGASKLRSSNNEPDGPTINDDQDDYEDRVHDLAMIVFNSSGEIASHFFDNNIPNTSIERRFRIKLKPGTFDFYFVANMDWNKVTAINTKSEMENYLSEVLTLDNALYEAAKNKKGFPMARVYKNQSIAVGGTMENPVPFEPEGAGKPVQLIRVVAKLEVSFPQSSDLDMLDKVTLKNAFTYYHLNHDNVALDPSNTGYKEVQLKWNDVSESYIAYMPEAIVYNSTQPNLPVWGALNHEPINYFVIENKSGDKFEIPIITANQDYNFTDDYLKFATGQKAEQPDYNIFRNRLYKYVIKNIAAKDIEIGYNIKDWELVPTSLYMGYGYNVEIDPDGNIKITNTIDDCMPHLVELIIPEDVDAYFETDTTKKKVTYGYTTKGDEGFTEAQMKTGYSEGFKLNNIPASGPYLEVWYNGVKVKTFSK